MSVKRIRCTDDVQKRGIANLRKLMDDMPLPMRVKAQGALNCFELALKIIQELLSRAEKYQERDLKAKAAKP
ncbi:MAG: hypothetical protein EBR40_08210 [Proteobacteria bacterium]|nr:hypothetical protein [Pseudomonadota bacterium]